MTNRSLTECLKGIALRTCRWSARSFTELQANRRVRALRPGTARRWVHEGKLPRRGWMPGSGHPSDEWIALAPEREAARLRLEANRAKLRACVAPGEVTVR